MSAMHVLEQEILRLLRLHDEAGRRGLPSLQDLTRTSAWPEQEVRRVSDALETGGYVKGLHAMGSDWNPGYEITSLGKAALHREERRSMNGHVVKPPVPLQTPDQALHGSPWDLQRMNRRSSFIE